ncbi:hypothetical protein KUCAC02_003880, partial [Chaenocephalus aceratus]
EEIAKQVDNTSFVAVQADETTDVSCKSQIVIVLRYIMPDLTVTERSLEFVELKEKLIAQTYDGAAVMSGNVRGGSYLSSHLPVAPASETGPGGAGGAPHRGAVSPHSSVSSQMCEECYDTVYQLHDTPLMLREKHAAMQ